MPISLRITTYFVRPPDKLNSSEGRIGKKILHCDFKLRLNVKSDAIPVQIGINDIYGPAYHEVKFIIRTFITELLLSYEDII